MIVIVAIIVMISPRMEARPVRQLGARRPQADQGGKIILAVPVGIAGLHEIGPVGLHVGRQRRLR